MIYQKISSNSEYITELSALYNNSFPPDERREFSEILLILENPLTRFSIITVLNDEKTFIGFISYWTFDDFRYVEHFAVEPLMRGQKVGEHIMNHFISLSYLPIILEVELPEDELSKRRIKFYERLGFVLQSEIRYIQPPYDKTKNAIELLLMNYGYIDTDRFKSIIRSIHQKVYGVN